MVESKIYLLHMMKNNKSQLSVVAHAYNTSFLGAGAGGWKEQSQSGQLKEILSQNKIKMAVDVARR